MKTLDEVIFEAPYTMTPWEENAIYYLKEYRDYMKNEIIELQEEVKKQKEMIEFLEKPLTWDELRRMEDKPVYVEEKGMLSIWIIIRDVTENWLYSTDCNVYRHEEYGKIWQAYRKERE